MREARATWRAPCRDRTGPATAMIKKQEIRG